MTEQEVVRFAKEIVLAEKWQWCEPVQVKRTRRFLLFGDITWVVTTNPDAFGGNVKVRIDDESGKVISKGFYRS